MGNIFSWWGNNSSTSNDSRFTKIEQEISNLKKSISAKVDKVSGKSLSTNDFTDDYKGKVDSASNDISKINDAIEKITENGTVIPVNNDNQSTQEKDVDYVTPQMFGAIANGYTDDSEAIQKAVDSGKPVYVPFGRYLLNSSITITNKVYWNLYARNATFIYTGDNYAIRILGAENCHIEIGQITAMNGGGIEFSSNSRTEWNQYVFLSFNQIECKTDCIHVEVENDGWCTENQIHGGRFKAGENGVHVHHVGENYTNGWKFYNCGIEGVTNGFLFDAGQGYINDMVVVNSRYEESYETILKTIGFVFDCLWIGTSAIKPKELVCSTNTSRFEILAPIRTIWDGDSVLHRGCIIDGKLMGERPQYETIN